MNTSDTSSSLRQFLAILFKHKRSCTLVFLAVMATVTIGTYIQPPTYETSASVMVNFGREYIS